jgi:hypothetical protein
MPLLRTLISQSSSSQSVTALTVTVGNRITMWKATVVVVVVFIGARKSNITFHMYFRVFSSSACMRSSKFFILICWVRRIHMYGGQHFI